MGGLRMENEKELKITSTRKKQIESKKQTNKRWHNRRHRLLPDGHRNFDKRQIEIRGLRPDLIKDKHNRFQEGKKNNDVEHHRDGRNVSGRAASD